MKLTVNNVDFEFVEVTARNGCRTFWMPRTHTTEAQWCAVMGGDVKNGPRFPKAGVSLEDCEAFCKEINRLTNGEFRLPTEFEFNAAIGIEPPDLENYAVFEVSAIAEVGTKKPNDLGICDLHGLLWHHLAPEKKLNGKPRKRHTLRGGSWFFTQLDARAVLRYNFLAAFRNYNFGFRVVAGRPPSF